MSDLINAIKKIKFSGLNLFFALTLLVIFVLTLISGIIFNNYLHTPTSKNNQETSFTINSGEGVREISTNLKNQGLIKNDFLFLVYLKINGLVGSIRAGEYQLSKSNSPIQIADILSEGRAASRKITIPEGWTNDQIGNYLDKQGVVTKAEFVAATKKHYSFDFLKDVPNDVNLEGFLFPDTYQVSYKATADEIVQKMLENFDKKLSSTLREQIKSSGYNTYQIISLASIVEKEVSKPQDRRMVAGIFLKRLDYEMPLQSDVTVIYALNTNKKSLTNEDIEVDSPYNTYKYAGIPYGPISNPGLESIEATLNPERSDFIYFLASDDGTTYYAKTLEEHEINKEKYIKQ